MDFGLKDKVCVITGGARGIGLADAFALGAENNSFSGRRLEIIIQ